MAELIVIAVNAAAVVPGYALLHLLDVRGRGAVGVGLAYLAGVASVLAVQAALTPVGLPVHPAVLAGIVVVLCIAALIRWRLRVEPRLAADPLPDARPCEPFDGWRVFVRVALSCAAAGGATVLVGLLAARVTPLTAFDAWAQWIPKAEVLAHGGLTSNSLWGNSLYAYVNPDYPLGLPLFHADQLRIAGITYGSSNLPLLAIGSWLLVAAFATTLLAPRTRGIRMLVLPAVLCFVAAPGIQLQAREALADVPLAVFLALGALLLMQWVETRHRGDLVLATLFLAVAANMKDEGTAAAFLVCLGALGIVSLRRDGRAAVVIAGALGALGVAVAPWRIWLAAHHIRGVISLRHAVDPSYLAARASRIPHSLDAVLSALARPGEYLLLPATALLVLLFASFRGRAHGLRARYYLILILGYVAIVVWAQWASPLALSIYLPEADRFMTSAAALGLVGIVDLIPRLLVDAEDFEPSVGRR